MAVKAAVPEKFSLVTFGIAQVVMDLQPLAVRLGAGGPVHGWTHTFAAAIPLGLGAALLGKLLTPLVLKVLSLGKYQSTGMPWRRAISSGLIGSLSHVLLDGLIYPDMSPFWPLVRGNPISIATNKGIYIFCVLSGIVGLVVYLIRWMVKRSRSRIVG